MTAYNRPDLLDEVLKKLPLDGRDIYVSIDGPKNNAETTVVNNCIELSNNFKKQNQSLRIKVRHSVNNMGCKYGVISAINWAFETETSLIIIEDDVRAVPEFFQFCDLGLDFFQNNEKIWQINGWTPLDDPKKDLFYYTTIHAHIWGWATWKSRWLSFDSELVNWSSKDFCKMEIFKGTRVHRHFFKYWTEILEKCRAGKIDTWDTQWLFSMWLNDSLAISPSQRLCGNVGFDSRATHTPEAGGAIFSKLPKNDLVVDPNLLYQIDSTLNFDLYHDIIAYKLDSLNLNIRLLNFIIKFRQKFKKIVFNKYKAP